MLRTMMKSKIHRATVTQADLHYVGSVTVDEDLLDAADLLPGELVHIVDVTNGARLETYTIAGERGSGVIGINGAAARLVHPGDVVILIGYGQMETAEAKEHKPHVVFVDADRAAYNTYWVETYGRGKCPPGLAKKHNGCLPPGQAKKRYVVGQPLPPVVVVERVPTVLVPRLRTAPPGYFFFSVCM